MSQAAPPLAEAEQVIHVAQRYFGQSLLAVYLHGSAVKGGLRPNSDLDVIMVVDQPTTHQLREQLVSELIKISGHPGSGNFRPLELIVFHRDELLQPSYPARSEFIYGEWLREAFEAGEIPEPVSDPELTIVLAQAKHEAKSLMGPEPAELLPIIPHADLNRAIEDVLPTLLNTLEGDERNVLLTLVRMWRTLTTAEFVPKDVAAEWAIPRLPAESAALIGYARDAYLGLITDDWSALGQEARRVANDLRNRLAVML